MRLNVVALGLMILAIGCKSFDDVNPTDEFPGSEVPKSTYNIELVLNEAYAAWARLYCSEHLPDALVIADYSQAIEGTRNYEGLRNKFDYLRTQFENSGLWGSAYSAINQANFVLKFTETDEEIDPLYPVQRPRLRGEALFIRAFSNFILIRYYGRQYTDEASAYPGIILRDEPATGFNSGGRSSVQDTYDQILADLEEAEALIPVGYDNDLHADFPSYAYRANKVDVLALKARVQFQMNDMSGTLSTLNSILGGAPGELSPTLNWPADGMALLDSTTYNGLFAVTDISAVLRPSTANYVVSAPSQLLSRVKAYTHAPNSSLVLNEDFFNLFYEATDSTSKYPGGRRMGKLEGDYVRSSEILDDISGELITTAIIFYKHSLNVTPSIQWPSIRLEELILTRAEIYALQGQGTAAVADLNLIRANRGADILDSAPARIQLINLIAQERMLELVGEGSRFFDWKRMGAYNATVEPVYDATMYSSFSRLYAENIVWDSPETLYRIPETEIARNNNLTDEDQNP